MLGFPIRCAQDGTTSPAQRLSVCVVSSVADRPSRPQSSCMNTIQQTFPIHYTQPCLCPEKCCHWPHFFPQPSSTHLFKRPSCFLSGQPFVSLCAVLPQQTITRVPNMSACATVPTKINVVLLGVII